MSKETKHQPTGFEDELQHMYETKLFLAINVEINYNMNMRLGGRDIEHVLVLMKAYFYIISRNIKFSSCM